MTGKKSPGTASESSGQPVIVLVIGAGSGIEELERILAHSRWTVLRAATISEAEAALRDPQEVVVCEATLADGAWKDVLDRTSVLPSPPPVIITAPHADDSLWMEVLNRGGYNVLGRPYREKEVFHLISTAWLRQRDKARSRARAFRAG